MLKVFIFSLLLPFLVFSKNIAIISDSIGSDHAFPSFPVILGQLNPNIKVFSDWQGSTYVGSAFKRLEKILETETPDLLIITLGINDALAGRHSANKVYNDFARVINLAIDNNIQVMIGTIDFTSYHFIINNSIYEEELNLVYKRLANDFNITLFPFLYKFFVEDTTNTIDGFHPTRKGQRQIAENLNRHINEMFICQFAL